MTLAQELSKRLRGRVADGGDVDYSYAIGIDNGRVTHAPRLVVVPRSAEDVAETIAFARSKSLQLTTKSGGHSAAGYCLNTGGIVIDLREIRQIALDPATGLAKVGAGAQWREVYDYMEMSGTGQIPIGGGCPGVGVGGFLLGGGFSFVSRSYGLGSDNVTGLTIVTADGNVRALSRNSPDASERELFWACQGGGGGNFGVATEFEIQTRPPRSEAMLVGQIAFPFYRIEEILEFYNEWERTLPPEMALYGFVGSQPDLRNGNASLLALRFTPVYNGDFGEGISLLQPLFAKGPISAELHKMTLPEWEDFIGSVTLVKGRSAYMRSAVLRQGGMTDAVARTLMKYMARCPSSGSFLVWTHLGGVVDARGPSDSAFPHRGARFVPEVKSIWDSARPEDMRVNVEWAHKFFEEMAAEASGAYVNYIDPLLSDWPRKYYGDNYDRLVKVKEQCDPDGVFSFQQGIGSTFVPSMNQPLDLSPLFRT